MKGHYATKFNQNLKEIQIKDDSLKTNKNQIGRRTGKNFSQHIPNGNDFLMRNDSLINKDLQDLYSSDSSDTSSDEDYDENNESEAEESSVKEEEDEGSEDEGSSEIIEKAKRRLQPVAISTKPKESAVVKEETLKTEKDEIRVQGDKSQEKPKVNTTNKKNQSNLSIKANKQEATFRVEPISVKNKKNNNIQEEDEDKWSDRKFNKDKNLNEDYDYIEPNEPIDVVSNENNLSLSLDIDAKEHKVKLKLLLECL